MQWSDSGGRRFRVRIHLNAFSGRYERILGKPLDEGHGPLTALDKSAIKGALHALGAPDEKLKWGALHGFNAKTGGWDHGSFIDWLDHPSMVPDSWERRGETIRREHIVAMRTPVHASNAQLRRIEESEGFRGNWYFDAVNVRTIAFGHTGPLPPGAHVSVPLTPVEGARLLRYDLRPYEAAPLRLVHHSLLLGHQQRFDVAVDFAYNCGIGALASSTFLREWNRGDIQAAADALLLWNKGMVNGRLVVLGGLDTRCKQRRKLFLAG